MLDLGERWISEYFPPDLRDDYAKLFRRRFAFNMARHLLMWLDVDAGPAAICALLDWRQVQRVLIAMLRRIPFVGRMTVLAYLALRLRPFSFRALAASWWRVRVVERRARAELKRRLEQACAVETA